MVSANYQYDPVTLQPGTRALLPRDGVRRILDLGGGYGGNGAAAKQVTGADYLCVSDISPTALGQPVAGVDATQVCDIEADGALAELFRQHGPFDLVLCLDVLEHLVDPWRAVARIHDLLPEGGYLLASIPNVQNYRVILRAASGRWHYKNMGLFDRTHLRFFSRSTAIQLMTNTGLSLEGVGKTFGPAARDAWMDRLSLGLLGPFVTMQTQILARKTGERIGDPGFQGDALNPH